MKRDVIKTSDGSYTLSVPGLNESYHSIHGAHTESMHIFINAGLNECKKKKVRILEFGMGTGLNVFLSYLHSKSKGLEIYYHSIEKYPVTSEEIELINQANFFDEEKVFFQLLHDSEWDTEFQMDHNFTLFKEKSDFRYSNPSGEFDVVYFDAFSPDIQPDLWTVDIFKKIHRLCSSEAILTTYSAKGQVRRNLTEAGFKVSKLPGPPGKREFIKAIKAG